jgi:hypothetical protein
MKTCLLILAAVVIQPAMSVAQTSPSGAGFQQAQALGSSDVVIIAAGGRGGRGGLATGKPYSATAVTHTVQVLADGSQIETTRSQVLYRDDQGRTRTEINDGRVIRIVDPVAGISYALDTAAKTARTMEFITTGQINSDGTLTTTTANGAVSATATSNLRDAAIDLDSTRAGTAAGQATRNPNHVREDLGTQSFYGVQAHGVRTTNTMPVGVIGNNRELKTVTELWDSKDLGIVVKSVSTDPRFGTTTYELTNLSTASPDPSLFRVPSGYTVVQTPKRD